MANTVGELNVEIGAKLDKLEKALHKMDNSIKGAGKKAEKSAGAAFGKVGAAIAGAFAVDQIQSFAMEVIRVRSEFEKFEAVLANTLGSSGAATRILEDVKEMASQTPFSVQELSGAFVKLTNYGLKPSMESMRQYGDLASSVGKGFDQLAEAVADATTGEFERLKEFGIKAKKEGDKVTFTFKEQATTVDFTNQSIEEYIKSLGDLKGVSGSMAAISETLGGKVSNLGDSWDSLLNTIGETSFWQNAIGAINKTVQAVDKALQSVETTEGTLARRLVEAAAEGALEASDMAMFTVIDEIIMKDGKLIKSQEELEEIFRKNGVMYQQALSVYGESLNAYDEYVDEIINGSSEVKKNSEAIAENLDLLGKQNEAFIKQQQQLEDTKNFWREYNDSLGDVSMALEEIGMEEEEGVSDNITEGFDNMAKNLAIASEAGNLFGSTLQSAFEASLINGESFFETFAVGLKNMIAQLIAAAAASAILAGILSTIGLGTTGTFGAIFGGGDSGSGLGGGFGGFFKLLGTDLVASTGRTGGQQGRFN